MLQYGCQANIYWKCLSVILCACSRWHFLIASKCVFRATEGWGRKWGRERSCVTSKWTRCTSASRTTLRLMAPHKAPPCSPPLMLYSSLNTQSDVWTWHIQATAGLGFHTLISLSHAYFPSTLTHWSKDWSIAILIQRCERTRGWESLESSAEPSDATNRDNEAPPWLWRCRRAVARSAHSAWSKLAVYSVADDKSDVRALISYIPLSVSLSPCHC